MTRSEARRKLKSFIEEKHTILWMEWDVSKPKDLERCLNWMMDMLGEAGIIEPDSAGQNLLDRTDTDRMNHDEVVAMLSSLFHYAPGHLRTWAQSEGKVFDETLTKLQCEDLIKKTPFYQALAIRLTT